ncbi:hypothetical protein [Nocardioides pocheonensis]|uniref:Uncharacterized protein n=1 Tax=Nocardioides pocheonensis TaxID=661485 RepID=A0A3N0GNJ3_9ACTN|nr:hypothetical protein [Nocardioides pocheonensis]RNM13997.1 hypothetical protein EFL26_13740 [Nocardioides pocheonensis]
MIRSAALLTALAVAVGGPAVALAAPHPAASGPAGPTADRAASVAPIAGTTCRPFPADNYWNTDIRSLPVDPRSAAWLAHMSTGRNLHPDFGPSYGDGPNYGIPITVVGRLHPKVRVRFDYSSESDHVRYPFGRDTRIEGGRNSAGDKHAIVVRKGRCRLYETWNTRVRNGHWRAGSGATWSLGSNALRPDGWTSADAAGLPILPGLLRWSEVKAGWVGHAIRFTTDVTSRHHLWPARHDAGSTDSWAYPPMGARFRMKGSFDASGFSARARTVITAMKDYGLVLADNGSPWFFQGEQNKYWPPALVEELKRIPASAFEAVDTSSMG